MAHSPLVPSLPSSFFSIVCGLLLLGVSATGCGAPDAADVIRPILAEASLTADPSMPFEKAGVDLVLRLEAGANIREQTAKLEYARLFDGSTWRTNEPAAELSMRMPVDSETMPFEPGEVREVALEGFNPNELLLPFCGETMSLLVAIRTSGVHSLLGVSEDVLIDCGD